MREYSNTRTIEGKNLDLFKTSMKKSSSEIFSPSKKII